MRVWVTTVGSSVFAVVNPLWAACIRDGFVPGRVHLLKNRKVERNVAPVKDWVARVLECYDVKPVFEEHDCDEEDMDAFAKVFIGVVRSEAGNEIAVDMTPGRKFMSACAMAVAMADRGQKFNVSKLYYLYLFNAAYQDRPYILIPFNQQRLVNVLECVREGYQ
nr:hypothetical protein [Candidatus Freyarchaeota archaeon]